MRLIILLTTLAFGSVLQAQTVTAVAEPEFIAIDSKDNVFAALKYGIIRITPDGKIKNLTKVAGTIGDLDRIWKNLIVDSKDNLYANDGNRIFKFSFIDDKLSAKVFAGQQYTYKLEDGPLATAAFNTIYAMAIDQNDNIYVIDSYDKIKDAIGTNFITDPYYAAAPAKTRGNRDYRVIRKISRDEMVTTLKTRDGKYIVPNNILGFAIDAAGNFIYASHGRYVGRIDLATGVFSLVAGQPYKRQYCPVYTQGAVAIGELVNPENIIINKLGEIIYADQRMHRLTKIAGGKVSTLAGNSIIDPCSQNIGGRAQEGNRDGKALTALFNFPKGMAYDSKGNLFIADMYNHSLRKLSADGMVTTFAK